MARISEIFGLGKTQGELDFVDIDPDRDKPLYLDPFLLSRNTDSWSVEAYNTLSTYFQFLIESIRNGNDNTARDALRHLSEPNDTCLGVSAAEPMGRGVGGHNADDILRSFQSSEAVQTGLVEDIQDSTLFIDGIGRDKISDMTTNVIRNHLIKYTKEQCNLWDIPLQRGSMGFFWSSDTMDWQNTYDDLLIVDGRRILLVPKYAVTYSPDYSAYTYHQHFALDFLQADHLRRGTNLVKTKELKGGRIKRYVTKKDLQEHELPRDKQALTAFTRRNPQVFETFKEELRRTTKNLTDEEIDNSFDQTTLINFLIARLRQIPAGRKTADEYHNLIKGITELLFYPQLRRPAKEQPINRGRKRIDIMYTNGSREGYFADILQHRPAMYVPVECKNYSDDLANEEFDQLTGRLSPGRGMIGLIVCRTLNNENAAFQRCMDAYIDGQKVVLTLTDGEIIELLEARRDGNTGLVNEMLHNKTEQIILRTH